jgi:plasmid stabilization system protein ParE
LELKFTPSARAQFLSAVARIAQENRTAARRFRQRADQSLRCLRRFLASGSQIAEFPDIPHREVYVAPCRFFYRVVEKTVWVVGVWHGTQIPRRPELGSKADDRGSREPQQAP